ncbi:hypothetical protein N9L68_06690 [bacterium]|nr:hypothetical protein [bacterium]
MASGAACPRGASQPAIISLQACYGLWRRFPSRRLSACDSQPASVLWPLAPLSLAALLSLRFSVYKHLDMRWIPSEHNPADAPSRFRNGSRELLGRALRAKPQRASQPSNAEVLRPWNPLTVKAAPRPRLIWKAPLLALLRFLDGEREVPGRGSQAEPSAGQDVRVRNPKAMPPPPEPPALAPNALPPVLQAAGARTPQRSPGDWGTRASAKSTWMRSTV